MKREQQSGKIAITRNRETIALLETSTMTKQNATTATAAANKASGTANLSDLVKRLLELAEGNGKDRKAWPRNSEPSKDYGIRTYKAQAELFASMALENPTATTGELARAWMELPDNTRDAFDYGRSAFRYIAQGKLDTPATAERKAELRDRLTAHEQGAATRKAIMALLIKRPDCAKQIMRLMEIPDTDCKALESFKASLT